MEAAAFVVHMPGLPMGGVTATRSVDVPLLIMIMSAAGPMYVLRFCFFFVLVSATRTMDVFFLPAMIMPASGPMYMSLIF